jgi:uncharacterized SAM-binding protein YcdF (DUF218 family)
MDYLVRNAVALMMIPPGTILLLGLLGLLILRRRQRLGRLLIALSLLTLYALSISPVADRLLQALEPPARTPLAAQEVQAVVVLGGGTQYAAPEYGGSTVIASTLVRLRYAARLHRATGKPVLVSGGDPREFGIAEAALMKQTLNDDFGVPVEWTESLSRTTLENAQLTRKILEPQSIRSIYLVTHAWHMPRARLAFEHAGFSVIPAATEYAVSPPLTFLDFVPKASALRDSSRFFHEILGIAWYRLKFFF